MPVQPAIAGSRTFQGSGPGGAKYDWVPYTPDWYSGPDPVTLGDGHLYAQYRAELDLSDGYTVDVQVLGIIGSATSFSAGVWKISMPYLGVSTASDGFQGSLAVDLVGNYGMPMTGTGIVVGGSGFLTMYLADGSPVGSTQAWAVGDVFEFNIRYHARYSG